MAVEIYVEFICTNDVFVCHRRSMGIIKTFFKLVGALWWCFAGHNCDWRRASNIKAHCGITLKTFFSPSPSFSGSLAPATIIIFKNEDEFNSNKRQMRNCREIYDEFIFLCFNWGIIIVYDCRAEHNSSANYFFSGKHKMKRSDFCCCCMRIELNV